MESILKIQNEHGNELCHVFRSEKVFRKDFFLIHKHTSLELSLIISGSVSSVEAAFTAIREYVITKLGYTCCEITRT